MALCRERFSPFPEPIPKCTSRRRRRRSTDSGREPLSFPAKEGESPAYPQTRREEQTDLPWSFTPRFITLREAAACAASLPPHLVFGPAPLTGEIDAPQATTEREANIE
jgi:hypothetical protein